jgi:alpha-glucosidase
MSTDPVKYKLPYVPTGRDLEEKSISLDAIHEGGVTELDAHSLFGTMESKATHEWFASNNKRTMIIERSSFAGMGKFASRWLGDNFSSD